MIIRTKHIFTTLLIFSLLLTFSVVSALASSTREYPYFYKSHRSLGMGGANVAIGGSFDSLFYNPAGLSMVPVDDWETSILKITGEVGKNTVNFTNDLLDAFDKSDENNNGKSDDDQMRAVNDVLAQYRGDNLHLRLANVSGFAKNSGDIAFGFGNLDSMRFDAVTHQGFGSNGFLELDSELLYGGVGGISIKKFAEGLSLGLSVKYFHKEHLQHNFTAREIVDKQDDLQNYVFDDLKNSGDAIGFDFGSIYQFARDSWLRPSTGFSVMNIGGMYFGNAGKIPMTVNLGFAANPEISVFESLTIGLDYVDILNTLEQDNNLGKRLRFGGELQLFDVLLASMAVRGGLYQGYPSYGADLRLLIFEFSFLSYGEEIGAYAGQKEDRRTLVMLNIGW